MPQKVNAAEQAFTPGKTAPSKSSALTRIVKIRQYSEQNKLFADFLLNYMRHHTWGLTRCKHICETSTVPCAPIMLLFLFILMSVGIPVQTHPFLAWLYPGEWLLTSNVSHQSSLH